MSQYPKYFSSFTSCNRNWTITASQLAGKLWCGTCPKCAFSFALLAAQLPKATVIDIFGQDLFANAKLLPLYRELWGEIGFKPFECVGTPEETHAALYLAHSKGEFAGTPVMEAFAKDILPGIKHPDSLVAELLATGPTL